MFKIKNPASLKTSTRPLGKIKPMSTRNVVKRHLKEWNKDEDEEIEEEEDVKPLNKFTIGYQYTK